MSAVTRLQIADHVAGAFGSTGATKGQLLASAEDNEAPPGVLEHLHRLPERHFAQLRDLWPFLAEVPVD
ncbi:MAG: DUF2795 domain-containing protein [Actinomycetota bacterium]